MFWPVVYVALLLMFFLNFSKLDIHAVHYCIAINTQRNQKSLCEAIINSTKSNVLSKDLCFTPSFDHLYHKRHGNSIKLGKYEKKNWYD